MLKLALAVLAEFWPFQVFWRMAWQLAAMSAVVVTILFGILFDQRFFYCAPAALVFFAVVVDSLYLGFRKNFALRSFQAFIRLWPWAETERAGKDRALALAGLVLSYDSLERAECRIKAEWNVTRPAQDREIRKLLAFGLFLWFQRNWRGPESRGAEARALYKFLTIETDSWAPA